MTKQLPDVGPYTMVWRDEILTFGEQQFRVIIYGAFNAFGLIGPEINGIAILDETRLVVVADKIANQNSGYFGPSLLQESIVDSLIGFDAQSFASFINALPPGRARYTVYLTKKDKWKFESRREDE
jgi:hypothetical protein